MKIGNLVWLVAAVAFLYVAGCAETQKIDSAKKSPVVSGESEKVSKAGETNESDDEHAHAPGTHGGSIVEIGRDSYHCEPVLGADGKLKIFMLQSDETKILEVDQQTLTAYVKADGSNEQVEVSLVPAPSKDDTAGKTSIFEGTLPEQARSGVASVTVQNIKIAGERFRFSFELGESGGDHGMPSTVSTSEARELYLTPGGVYTQADIEANGKMTAAEKFKTFRAAHDMNPKSGDKICPVTATKANDKCTWIVGGKTYEFCCPPCVDEFVSWAKSEPSKIQSPEVYVKQ
ncbi:MAG: hypothetical protein ABL888_09100 [Pirellulaceae bacterium]